MPSVVKLAEGTLYFRAAVIVISGKIEFADDRKDYKIFMKEELIETAGVIIDTQPNAFFKVQINNTEHIVLAQISGKMRKNRIRILMGDRVDLEMSPYDLNRGRITYRHK